MSRLTEKARLLWIPRAVPFFWSRVVSEVTAPPRLPLPLWIRGQAPQNLFTPMSIPYPKLLGVHLLCSTPLTQLKYYEEYDPYNHRSFSLVGETSINKITTQSKSVTVRRTMNSKTRF